MSHRSPCFEVAQLPSGWRLRVRAAQGISNPSRHRRPTGLGHLVACGALPLPDARVRGPGVGHPARVQAATLLLQRAAGTDSESLASILRHFACRARQAPLGGIAPELSAPASHERWQRSVQTCVQSAWSQWIRREVYSSCPASTAFTRGASAIGRIGRHAAAQEFRPHARAAGLGWRPR